MESFPADVLEDRAGEVIDHRVQHTVEIREADGDVKSHSQFFQSWTDLRFLQGGRRFLGLDPNQQLQDVARQKADDEENRHHSDEAQSPLHLRLLAHLPSSQVDDDFDRAVKNHKHRHVEGDDKLKLMPGQIVHWLNREALTVGCVHMLQRQDMSRHGDSEQPQSQSPTHGFGDTERVDGMMRMHHTHVSVSSNGHQE